MNELTTEKTMTTKEVAEALGTRPNVITENAKKCLPNKMIENGKTTYWTQAEVTVLLDCMKSHKVGAGVNLSNDLIGTSTELTPALKLKKALELAQEALKDHFAQDNNKEVTPDFIVQIVADQYGIDPGDIKSKKRSQDIALPRQIVMYLCNKCIGMSSTEIGRYLERDHSTVIHGIDKMAEVLAAEKKSGKNDITSRIDVIKKKLSL